jgi:aldose 1-epimerase
LAHRVTVLCPSYTPTDVGLIPTGELRPVAGTELDLRTERPLSSLLTDEFGFDDNFCTNCDLPGALRPYAVVSHPGTGLRLKMSGTLPGVQFYTGNFLPNAVPGKSGKVYERQGAFCLEPQFYPDSVNNKLCDCVLSPGEKYAHSIVWDFE